MEFVNDRSYSYIVLALGSDYIYGSNSIDEWQVMTTIIIQQGKGLNWQIKLHTTLKIY